MLTFDEEIKFIKKLYSEIYPIPLHRPFFSAADLKHVMTCLDSSFVSTAGGYVDDVESALAEMYAPSFVVPTVSGSAALELCLKITGVNAGDIVITQALSFVATANSIKHVGAEPIFIDVDLDSLGLSASKLENWLTRFTYKKNNFTYCTKTNKRVSAVIPMHTFGHPVDIEDISKVCLSWNIPIIEDAAESFGSRFKSKLTGTFGRCGAISFNGNKIITAGGGGAMILNNYKDYKLAKHLASQAKISHKYEYFHDMIGHNYKMPSLNASLLFSQIENFPYIFKRKREIAKRYKNFFQDRQQDFFWEKKNRSSNFWLNVLILNSEEAKFEFLNATHSAGINTRPTWCLLHKLPMYKNNLRDDLTNSQFLAERIVCLPSSIV
jgi:perosamine synthetase